MAVPSRFAFLVAAGVAAVAVVGSGVVIAGQHGGQPDDVGPAAVRAATEPVEVLRAPDDQAAIDVSRRLFAASRTVVLASATDPGARATSIAVATSLRVPILIDGPDAATEIDRLGAKTVLTVGTTKPVPRSRPLPVDASAAAVEIDAMDLPAGATGTVDTVLVVRSEQTNAAAVANARSAGATVVEVDSGDLRTSPDAARALAKQPTSPVIAVDVPRDFPYTLDVVRRDVEQPTGGYLALPGRHYAALYGHPDAASLGLLGEQGVEASVRRVEHLADQYRDVSGAPFVPTFEIIATVASAGAGTDKNYSSEAPISRLEPLVDAAEKAGVYVILDLQPGRTDFLTQAKLYRPLLARPHVGLALDPEWRLAKEQRHLRQIGSVSAAEINRTSAWLAALTREESLPQKLFVVHQFTGSMIKDRSALDTSHAELATVIHVDGSGSQPNKKGTWKLLHRKAPVGLAGWGWKNFVDEDSPMLSVPTTWSTVRPHPDLITYQ